MKKNAAKRTLQMIALSLLLCVSMLIGTTFAWFTDSVTSANNIIKSGNLDVEMYWAEGTEDPDTAEWIDASTGAIFDYDLWEPGYTQVRHIKIENKGSLALKYKLSILANGEVSNLADVIDVYYLDPAARIEGRTDLTEENKLGTLTQVLKNFGETGNGALQAGDDDTVTIALKMRESAGNEYQDKSIGANFAIHLFAAQQTYESDSFDDQYDEDSEYFELVTDSETAFEDICRRFENGGTVMISSDFTIKDPNVQNSSYDETHLTINGNVDLFASDTTKLAFDEITVLEGSGTLTIHGGELVVIHELYVSDSVTLIINRGTYNTGTFGAIENGKIIINGGVFNDEGTRAGMLYLAGNGKVLINEGVLNMKTPINMNHNSCANTYVEINGGKLNLVDGLDKLFIVRNNMDGDTIRRGSSIKITGGTITATYPLDSSGDANAFIRNEDNPHDGDKVIVSPSDYNCVVTGGTFYGCWTRTGETTASNMEVWENTIVGFVADGYQMTGDAVNGYIVTKQ